MIIAGSIAFSDYPLEDALARIRACGFDGVEMWQPHLARCRTPGLLAAFRRRARALGLELFGLNVIGFDWFRPFGSDAELAATLCQLKADIDYAVALGVRDVMIWEGVQARTCRAKRAAAALPAPPPDAAGRGLALRRGAGPEHPLRAAPVHRWRSRTGSRSSCTTGSVPRISATSTTAATTASAGPTDYAQAVRSLGHRIRHVHFADSDMATSELHFPPGEGTLDLGAIVAGAGLDRLPGHDLARPLRVAAARTWGRRRHPVLEGCHRSARPTGATAMRAAVLQKLGEPLVVADVPVPAVGPGEVLVATRTCGLCGTDLHICDGLAYVPSLPHIPGHEPAGVIAALGDGVTGWRVGQRVVPHLFVTCGHCDYCRVGRDVNSNTTERGGNNKTIPRRTHRPAVRLGQPAAIPSGGGGLLPRHGRAGDAAERRGPQEDLHADHQGVLGFEQAGQRRGQPGARTEVGEGRQGSRRYARPLPSVEEEDRHQSKDHLGGEPVFPNSRSRSGTSGRW